MDAKQQKARAEEFVERWRDRGDEKQEAQKFWIDLLHTVYGVDNPAAVIDFEQRVKLSHVSFIDGYIPSSKVLIEQKGCQIDLRKKEKQSDGTELTPYEQAVRYVSALRLDDKPRYIVVSNFQTFEIYDQNVADPLHQEPITVRLEELPKAFNSLSFLVNLNAVAKQVELDVSVAAGALVKKLYDALLKQFGEGADHDPAKLQALNKLCVRLVFCLYAEDADLFPIKNQFGAFLNTYQPENIGDALEKLFRVLNTPSEKRASTLGEKFRAFPYVNGGLFAEDDAEIPPFNEEVAHILIAECSDGFNWAKISPTIFGAIFESTLNPETRRQGGMHYTSIENIHKVIDPLFLDELKQELDAITNDDNTKYGKRGRNKLRAFQDKLASLKFLDPACGSGNFLTETYIQLRRLENTVLMQLGGEMADMFSGMAEFSPIKVSLDQFYGIEINDFAVSVAQTALWIAESQLLQETEKIVGYPINFLPLKSYSHIVEGNALRLDWKQVVPRSELSFIMGNPPFVGARLMTAAQKDDVLEIFNEIKGSGNLDYVTCWYKKAADYMKDTRIETALVSTNSISQGLQVPILWEYLNNQGITINFAYRTFIWDSEAQIKAHVHCVIIGFAYHSRVSKIIYDHSKCTTASNINGYLLDAINCYITDRKRPLCNISPMVFGSMPNDGGYLTLNEAEYSKLITGNPSLKQFIKPFIGADEFINDKKRYCLWLKDKDYSDYPEILERVKQVKELREKSARSSTKKLAEYPHLFGEIRQPEKGEYLLVPRVSSENRKYIPIGFLSCGVIASDATQIIPNASLFEFGVLTSSVHNAWTRAVAGRLKSDYRYSASIVYNNFIWIEPNEGQRALIIKTAQCILDIRDRYLAQGKSLADLYGEKLELAFIDLYKAHQANDQAVLALYGFRLDATEEEIVAKLMQLYAKKIEELG